MDPEIEIVDDPYLGLRLQAWQVHQIQQIGIRRVNRWPPISGGSPSMLDIWADIGNFLRTLLGYLDPYWLWQKLKWYAIDPFQTWFREHILNPLLARWQGLQGSLIGWWEGAITRITNIVQYLSNRVHDVIDRVSTALRNTLDRVIGSIRDRIEAIRAAIINKIHELIDRFRTFIDNLREMIRERISNLIARIVESGRDLRERLTANFANLWERITTGLRELRERIWQSILEMANRLREIIGDKLRNFFNLVVAAIQNWWKQHGPQILDAAEKAIRIARPHIEKWVGEFKKLPASFLEYVATGAGTDLALQPSRALSVAGTLYTTSIVAGSLAMTMATALNMIPATNWVGAQQFAAYISEVAGFEPITRATYGVLLNEVLAIPLRYHWNQMLRPKLPTEGEIFIMGRKHGITEAEFRQAMGMQGIPNWWITKMYDFFWTDPSPYWLLRMSEGGIPRITDPGRKGPWLDQWLPGWANNPDAWLIMKLMLAGYEDVDIAPMIEGIKRRALGPPITQFKTSVRAMRREAYWTDEQTRESLAPFGVRAEEVLLLIAAEELDYQNKFLDEQVKLYVDAFVKEEIDAEDLYVALSTIIVKPERVSQIVTREQIRKLPKPKAPKAPKEDPEVAKIRAAMVQGHINMFRKRVIEANQLYSYLLADGLSESLARATAIKEASSRIKSPPLDSPYFLSMSLQLLLRENLADYDDLFDKGEITIGEYLHALRALGLDEATITYLADVARLRQFLGELPTRAYRIEAL